MTYIPEIVYIGRQRSSPDPMYADLVENWLRGYVANDSPYTVWVREARFRGGRSGSTAPWVRPLAYNGSPGAITTLRITFNPVYLTTYMGDSSQSKEYSSTIEGGVKGHLLPSGTHLGLVLHTRLANGRVNMKQASEITADDEKFYDRTGYASTTPPSPMGHGTPVTEGHLTFWLVTHRNVAPLTPVSVNVTNLTSLTPTIEAVFQDYNGAAGGVHDCGDILKQAKIEVRRKSDLVSFWNHTYTVTAGEQTANKSSRVYGNGGTPTTLVRGTVYQARVTHYDQGSLASPASAWVDFTVISQGQVLVTAPTGKQDDLSPLIGLSWTHQTGLSTNAIQILVRRGGTLVYDSGTVAKTVANGASTTHAWPFADLEPGATYEISMLGRDTANVWSPESPRITFTIDAAPGIPVNVSPKGGVVLPNSSYPKLVTKVTDGDADDLPLTVKAEILTGAGSLISTRTMSLVAGTTDTYEYQTIAADIASVGSYKWRSYAGDGFLWSGGTTVEASATRSVESLFSWAAVPAVTITAPAALATLNESSPTVTWTVTDQDSYQFRVLRSSDQVELYSTGITASTSTRSRVVPVGIVKNGGVYDFEVMVRKTGLDGFDVNAGITIEYTPPPSITGLLVSAMTVNQEPFPTAAELIWDPYLGSTFIRYLVYADYLPDRPLAELTAVGDTRWVDYHAPPGGASYTVTVVEERGVDEYVESEDATAVLEELPVQGIVLVSIAQPTTQRFVYPGWDDIEFIPQGEEEEFLTWGAGAPIPKRGEAEWDEASISCRVVREVTPDPSILIEGIRGIYSSTGASFRDAEGYRRFVGIRRGSLSISRLRQGGYEVEAELRQREYIEGIFT